MRQEKDRLDTLVQEAFGYSDSQLARQMEEADQKTPDSKAVSSDTEASAGFSKLLQKLGR